MNPTPAAGQGSVLAVRTEAEAQEVRGLGKTSGSGGKQELGPPDPPDGAICHYPVLNIAPKSGGIFPGHP